MVVSHNLDEQVLLQRCSTTSDHQYPNKHHYYYNHQNNNNNNNNNTVCRLGQSAQDKRSRLSNVINNIKKKVPESSDRDNSDRDGRNSIERNLETLEKYVMTVLNGVIKDAETEGRKAGGSINGIVDSGVEDASRFSGSNSKEDARIITENGGDDTVVNREPSEPSAVEPAVPDGDKTLDKREMEDEQTNQSEKMATDMQNEVSSSAKAKELSVLSANDLQIRKSLPDSDNAILDEANDDTENLNHTEQNSSNTEARNFVSSEDIRTICRDILNYLLNDISQMFENTESIDSPTSLHCSLPLDKIAPALQICESIEVSTATQVVSPKSSSSSPSSTSPSTSSSPKSSTPRAVKRTHYLCLYCERTFTSISWRQRHIERDHQFNSERRTSSSTRRSSHNCRYCSDKSIVFYVEDLEGLFQHMITYHTDKYHICVQCNTRYSNKKKLAAHMREMHENKDKLGDVSDRPKDALAISAAPKELHAASRDAFIPPVRDLTQENQKCDQEHPRLESPPKMFQRISNTKDCSNPASPEFDSSFYSSVSGNIRENLLHHLDGKLENTSINDPLVTPDNKPASTSRTIKRPHYLCLYCERTFTSISCRQRHIESVHQFNSERRTSSSSRRSSHICRYCSDKSIMFSVGDLEGLFQHMITYHTDKYHICVQCNTRYSNKRKLATHLKEMHDNNEKTGVEQVSERPKDALGISVAPKDPHSTSRDAFIPSTRDLSQENLESDKRDQEHRRLEPTTSTSTPLTSTKMNMFQRISSNKDFSNPGSPDFDSSFYSSVSCNIRENLLNHLDGKLQNSSNYSLVSHDIKQHYQSFHEPGSQIQFPIDISLTAATPVDCKEYSPNDKCDSSKYAQKPGKTGRSHPRRVSFEKYNFPRKYDGKEQWTCSIKDLSKFDIYTQLTLRRKQEIIKDKNVNTSTGSISNLDSSEVGLTDLKDLSSEDAIMRLSDVENVTEAAESKEKQSDVEDEKSQDTQFSLEFGNFMKLRRWDECPTETAKSKEIVYAELTGEWSRPRVYICGACSARYLTLKEMEDHKVSAHPNVWCSHLEFSGDQRELYKHLFLPGKSVSLPTKPENSAALLEKICTKCSKICSTLAELHRHMLECGGDQAWLLGLFGNGKKKSKWRPFGCRSRRRRQRGMKRNIQNSQTPRVNQPKERQPSGPRVRPSDFESIQKMLANLPAKRSTRRDIQQTQSRLRKVPNRSRHLGENISSNTRLSSKAVLRNKLIKNAKSFQRKRCRGDNISAAIESVISNYKSRDRGNLLENKKRDVKEENGGETGNAGGSSLRKELNETSKFESSKFKTKSGEVEKNVPLPNNQSNKIVRSIRRTLNNKKKNLRIVNAKNAQMAVNNSTNTNNKENTAEKSVKTVKTSRKKVSKVELAERKMTKLGNDNVLLRKRKSGVQSSLNASIKAKTQLRTHDGKFARNPMRSASSRRELLGTSSQVTRIRSTRSDPGPLVTRSGLRMVVRRKGPNVGLKKRITRVSSDSDKMPTLEPVDGLMVCQEEAEEKSPNNLPILSPITSTTTRSDTKSISACKPTPPSTPKLNEPTEKSSSSNVKSKKQTVFGKKLAHKVEENNDKEKELSSIGLEKEDGSLKQGRDLRVRKRQSFSPKISNITSDKDVILRRQGSLRDLKFTEDDSDVTKKNSKPQVVTSGKKNEPYKVLKSRKARQQRRTGSLEELSHLHEVPLEVKKLFGPKDDLFTQIGNISKGPKIRRNVKQMRKTTNNKIGAPKEKIIEDVSANSQTGTSEKPDKTSPRRINRKEAPNDIDLVDGIRDKDAKEELPKTVEIPTTETTPKNSGGRNLRSKKSVIEVEPPPINVSATETIKATAIASIDNCDNKDTNENREESEADDSKSVEEHDKIVTVDLVSLSFEHLQQESSNSNLDSGKENSSETPVNITKAKISRPKKCRGFRRDRVVKRTLNNVIGILTEGVNIPVEVQQNVVLTVQTSIDNMNANSGIQNSRVELGDNSVSPNSVSSAVINDNNDENHRIINECVTNGDNGDKENTSDEIQRTNNGVDDAVDKEDSGKTKNDQDLKPETNGSQTSIVKGDVDEPNDIILDLSRRKTKGKGSFLEKIVSKIAKQKDALLEGEVGSLLDHAVDELSIILDEVGPSLGESNETAKNTQKDDINKPDKSFIAPTENNSELKEVENLVVTSDSVETAEASASVASAAVVSADPSTNIPNIRETSDGNTCESLENVDEINRESSEKTSPETQNEEEQSNKSESVNKEVEQDEMAANIITEDLYLDDIMKLINTPQREIPVVNEEKVRPGRRKNVDRQKKSNGSDEGNDTNSLTFKTDLKPQIDTIKSNKKTKQTGDKIKQSNKKDSPKKSKKRGTDVVENETKIDITDGNIDVMELKNVECKENDKKGDKIISDDVTDAKLTESSQEKMESQSILSEINLSNNESTVSASKHEMVNNKEMIKDAAVVCEQQKSVETRDKKNNVKPESDGNKSIMKGEKSPKLRKRNNNKKKSLADEHLELSDDETVKKINVHPTENSRSSNANRDTLPDQVNNQKNSQVDDTSQQQSADVTSIVEEKEKEKEKVTSYSKKAFKAPEVIDSIQPNTKTTRASKKKSLADEHLVLMDEFTITPSTKKKSIDVTENVTDVKSSNSVTNDTKENINDVKSKGRRSKKKTNGDDDDCFQINLPKDNKKSNNNDNKIKPNDTLIERRKTLKRKAKENIFLSEDLLDFGDDTDSLSEPETIKTCNESTAETEELPKDEQLNEGEKIITKEPQLNEIENKNEAEEKIPAELTSSVAEVTAPITENTVDDGLNVEKRKPFIITQDDVPTSVANIVVKKRKKGMKESAKFFCDLCDTGFTRKSSLKKHSQTLYHKLQVTKAGVDQENQEELMSTDDATGSSIHKSEVSLNEDHLETTTTTATIQTTTEITKETDKKDDCEEREAEEKKEEELLNNTDPKQSDNDAENVKNNDKLPEVKDDLTVIETGPTLNNQMVTDFEDELLDEEISKITENMTHDEYVLTDHISPMPEAASTPIKEPHELLDHVTHNINDQKFNLADEHLNLDSPILDNKQEDNLIIKFPADDKSEFDAEDNKLASDKDDNQKIDLDNPENIFKTDVKQIIDESKISLDFSNITEKLKNNEFIKNTRKTLGENNSNVGQHENNVELKDNLALNEEIKNIENVPAIFDNSVLEDVDTVAIKKKKEKQPIDPEHFDNLKKPNKNPVQTDAIKKDNAPESNRKLAKSSEKSKSKDNGKGKQLIENSSDDSDYDDKNVNETQSKSKIVKSVFGRALTGEKVDKVKEVLDDWVSRSDSESQEDSRNNWRGSWKDDKKNKHDKSKNPQQIAGKKTTATTTHHLNVDPTSIGSTTNELSMNSSRCRQSKKRAEERISRAFEEESISYELAYEMRKQSNVGKNTKDLKSLVEKEGEESLEIDSLENKKSKTKTMTAPVNELIVNEIDEKRPEAEAEVETQAEAEEEEGGELEEEEEDQFVGNYTNLKTKTDEFIFPDTNSMESIHTRVPSCPRERSSTPDLISLTTRDSENDEDVEDENVIRGRISPSYVSNLPESTVDSTISNGEDKTNREESVKINRTSSTEFTGEKIVIRSTVSSQESRSGVVTIAPTDAIEDNALDVPQETEESLKKSRQGKVLNFDEELFVECCSRLKASAENELRGTKKIKLDHSENYGSKEDQCNTRINRGTGVAGRWKDTDNQNSLGSLLESVNQLLGEEMYNRNRENEYHKRSRSFRSETPSPVAEVQSDFIQTENPGYEDSLDVAFEHNNKLRDKIQQRMRESENLIATSFGHKSDSVSNSNDETHHRHHHHHHRHHHHHHHHHHRQQNHGRHHDNLHHQRRHHDKSFDNYHKSNDNLDNAANNSASKHLSLEGMSLKNKMDPSLDGLLDKALSNILHNNGKHDHNASTPMNVLAELACAQVPTSTISDVKSTREKQPKTKALSNGNDWLVSPQSTDKIERDQLKKPRNPIKELFERKNELNDRKQHEKSYITTSEKESNAERTKQQKTKKIKRQDDFPLIRKTSPFTGIAERKKRRNDKKREQIQPAKVKDVYEFDDDDSGESRFGTTLSYRSRNEKNYTHNNTKSKEINVAELVSRTITKTLDNAKTTNSLGKRVENTIERKFHQIESSVPKTKGALKAYHVEEKQQQQQQQQQSISGPMDNFVERKRSRRSVEHSSKHGKTKKRTKNSKKRSRNAWYENDSSDEFVTAIKREDIGVGISKSQRTCSKGKQNLFAELSTSSESEYDENEVVYQNKIVNKDDDDNDEEITRVSNLNLHEDQNDKLNDWMNISCKNDFENKKSESDLSDQPLIIDERKESDEHDDNSDDDDRSERAFELDDLYREDSSDCEENSVDRSVEDQNVNMDKNDLIPLEKALDLLENSVNLDKIPENNIEVTLEPRSEHLFDVEKNTESQEDDECDGILENKNNSKALNVSDELNELTELPEKLSTNEKPNEKTSDNLPLHVFLSRKVQESKKRKEEQLKKQQQQQQQEEERVAMEFQSTRRQRKCAIGKQGLLAEISSSDEEYYFKNTTRRSADKSDYDKSRRQKRESKEKKKERYMEKKHEQIIAKEQKAIEEEILRELELKKEINSQDEMNNEMKKSSNKKSDNKVNDNENNTNNHKQVENNNKKRLNKKNSNDFSTVNKVKKDNDKFSSDTENKLDAKKASVENDVDRKLSINSKKENSTTASARNARKSSASSSNAGKPGRKTSTGANKKGKNGNDYSRSNSTDDEELPTTKSWNKVEEGVGVAIGRRKRAAANQLYYWSSSSDDDEEFIQPSQEVEEEADRQEQHGWIVGDSHKKMITMLAMEKQLKEKRRRSEEEFGCIKAKNKKHRNSTS